MGRTKSSANMRIGKPLWNVMSGVAAKPGYFHPRSDRDREALEKVVELINSVERKRCTDGRVMAILPLPSDARQAYWLSAILKVGEKGRVRASAVRARRRIKACFPVPPLAQALYARFLRLRVRLRNPELRFLEVRLCNLGYPTASVWHLPDPEGCLRDLDVHIRIGRQRGWLTAHMELQLAAERSQGLLS